MPPHAPTRSPAPCSSRRKKAGRRASPATDAAASSCGLRRGGLGHDRAVVAAPGSASVTTLMIVAVGTAADSARGRTLGSCPCRSPASRHHADDARGHASGGEDLASEGRVREQKRGETVTRRTGKSLRHADGAAASPKRHERDGDRKSKVIVTLGRVPAHRGATGNQLTRC